MHRILTSLLLVLAGVLAPPLASARMLTLPDVTANVAYGRAGAPYYSTPGYRGQLHDPTGLIFLRYRYYDPELGRFTSLDPIKDGFDWYAYPTDPVNQWDPEGLATLAVDPDNTVVVRVGTGKTQRNIVIGKFTPRPWTWREFFSKDWGKNGTVTLGDDWKGREVDFNVLFGRFAFSPEPVPAEGEDSLEVFSNYIRGILNGYFDRPLAIGAPPPPPAPPPPADSPAVAKAAAYVDGLLWVVGDSASNNQFNALGALGHAEGAAPVGLLGVALGVNNTYEYSSIMRGAYETSNVAGPLVTAGGAATGQALGPRGTGPAAFASPGRTGMPPSTPATRLADKARNLPASQRPNTVAVIKTQDGRIIVGRNQGGVVNEEVQNVLTNLPANQFNRQCAEVNAVARARNKDVDLRGANISVSNVRGPRSTTGVHGTPKPPCNACEPLLDEYGMNYDE